MRTRHPADEQGRTAPLIRRCANQAIYFIAASYISATWSQLTK
jgi:hypothetical protein